MKLSGFCRIVGGIMHDMWQWYHITSHTCPRISARCADKVITLNLDKCKFCESLVTFAGFQLSATGYQVYNTTTDAISKFPTLANCTDLRSFFSLINQLSACTNTISTLLTPLLLCSVQRMNSSGWSSMTKHFKQLKNLLPLQLCCHFLTWVSPQDFVQMSATRALNSSSNNTHLALEP